MTNREIKKYAASLHPLLEDVCKTVDAMVKEEEDTLSEDFQVAAAILEVFWQRCRQKAEA